MRERLNKNRIEYILFHLEQNFEVSAKLKNCFYFGEKIEGEKIINFPLSDSDINISFQIDNVPVLYPLNQTKRFYHFDNNSLIFEHDLLKSAFYLLSGYQETQTYQRDSLGRFAYDDSIQKKLNIAEIPLVNIYFDIIKQAVHEFCKRNSIIFEKKNIWGRKEFGFLLTHDVDRIDKWTVREVKRRLKMFMKSGFRKHGGYFLEAIRKIFTKENPYWNFRWMKDLENKLSLKSIWFFLPQGDPQIDAYYSFKESRIQKLAHYLQDSGDLIGLHGTYASRLDIEIMRSNLEDVQNLIAGPVKISRQHWLSFKFPETLNILESLGIEYDSSWGFAEHTGWRNSYCLPFHPYDFNNEKMMNIWELPLNAMDVTFFQYMNLSLDEAMAKIDTKLNT